MSEKLPKRLFFTSLAFWIISGVFAYGIAIGKFRIWPYELIEQVYIAAESLVQHGQIIPANRVVKAPSNASRERFIVYDADNMSGGYYAFTGWDKEKHKYLAWLYNNRGDLLHVWEAKDSKIDPDSPLIADKPPHPFSVLPDGSILVAFDHGNVMARLDYCGAPIWVKKGAYHHSLTRAQDGTYWTWRGNVFAYGHYNYLHNFDPETGTVIKEIGLVEDVITKMGQNSAIFGVRPDFKFTRVEKVPKNHQNIDIFHPNDIDVLLPEFANKFPLFEAGDLMISLRKTHLVAVLDQNTYEVKWWSHAPWRFQHDPDFTKEGTISVFSNNTGRRRSEIIQIDPSTMKFTNKLFDSEFRFYSASMGKHQYLPNDNVLIVIPGEGRAVELSSDGQRVMEFNNVVSENHNAIVSNGIWLPPDYFDQTVALSSSLENDRCQ